MIPAVAPPGASRAVDGSRVLTVGILTLLGTALLVALGLWQLERRVWKRDLMRKVETRFSTPARVLEPAATVDPAALEYAHVELAGTYLQDLDTWVHASTELGAGYWVLSPLRTDQGPVVLINRGFVPMDTLRSNVARASGHAILGVLRSSESNEMWPRRNEPVQDRWYSRDVPAIALARRLSGVAPYFIDMSANSAGAAGPPAPGEGAQAGDSMTVPSASAPVQPVPGLTVVNFRNAHLSYALTWFSLALMTTVGGAYVVRGELVGRARPR